MGADTPQGLHEQFAKYFNSADVDGLLTLYEDGATLLAAPGAPVSGKEAIQESLRQFLEMKATIEFVGDTIALEAGDLVLTHGKWTMKIEGMPDMDASTAEVARRQPDGTWKYVIDNPWGTGPLG